MSRVVWLAAGGTAGHIHGAVSVMEAFDDEVTPVLITTDRRVDHEVTEDLDVRIARMRGVGLARGARGLVGAVGANAGAMRANLATLASLPRPEQVISFGGFHTPLVSLVARSHGAQSYLLEQNAALTRANRLVGSWSRRIFLAWPVAVPRSWLPRTLVVGNPPRRAVVTEADRETLRASLGYGPEEIVVVVTSGSLGARSVNVATQEAARLLVDAPGVRIIHAMGSANALAPSPGAMVATQARYQVLGYEPTLYRMVLAADLVVARAGASTLTEIALAGVASIVVPLPHSPNDHQRKNAEVFRRAGAALVIEDDALSGDVLAAAIGDLVADGARRRAMGEAARRLAHPDAARHIWEEMRRR